MKFKFKDATLPVLIKPMYDDHNTPEIIKKLSFRQKEWNNVKKQSLENVKQYMLKLCGLKTTKNKRAKQHHSPQNALFWSKSWCANILLGKNNNLSH